MIVTAVTKALTLKLHHQTHKVLERSPEKPELLYMMNQESFEAKRTKRVWCRGIYSAESSGSIWGEAVLRATSAN